MLDSKRTLRRAVVLGALGMLALGPSRAQEPPRVDEVSRPVPPGARLRDEAVAARQSHDDRRLESLQRQALEAAAAAPDDVLLQTLVAELALYRADRLRDARKASELDSDTVSSYREQQAKWSEEALPHAERALELARSDEEIARAERVLGELYVHQISGPIAGLINGPRALTHMRKALEVAPEDPECQRAIGLMYLNNPPINGGDVDAAIATFRKCAEAVPTDDRYQFQLALAFRKKGKLLRAELAARKALKLNPRNENAAALVETIRREREEG